VLILDASPARLYKQQHIPVPQCQRHRLR